jgi:protein pelota
LIWLLLHEFGSADDQQSNILNFPIQLLGHFNMRLVKKDLNSDGSGSMSLLPQEQEDMWHLYNLIATGDHITGVSYRKVSKETSSGAVAAQKIKIKLTIKVEDMVFDSATCELRIKGKNQSENEYIKMGQYHTIELSLHNNFTLYKQYWDSIYLQRITDACDVKNMAELAAVIMQAGLANICLLTNSMTITKQKIELSIPRKRAGSSNHDSAIKKFFNSILTAMKLHINLKSIKCCLIASPAFLKDDFFKFIMEEAVKNDDKIILENKSKFLLVHSSSGFKHALKEVLADPSVTAKMDQTAAFNEVKTLDNFFQMLNHDPDRAYYGYKHVLKADQAKAVDTLLVTDDLFRSSDVKTRAEYVKLTESVKENGGTVAIFSTLHVTGEQLAQLSGVAAILRFPLPEADITEGDEAKEEEEFQDYEEKNVNKSNLPASHSMNNLGASKSKALPISQSLSSLSSQFQKDANISTTTKSKPASRRNSDEKNININTNNEANSNDSFM